ncbi:MAG TPA: SDR family NAD(P)-dependent oxidoreductase [Acidimicrobiales bacterium]
MIDFAGQAAVVTGAGRGLGRLYALEMARRGAHIVVNDTGGTITGQGSDPSVADGVVDEIRLAGGSAVASFDSVASPEGGAAIVGAALDAFGRVDAVVSNAGIYEMAAIDKITPERWRDMLGVHLDGGFYVAQPAFTAMKAQGYGRFVFVASQMGAFGQHRNAAYASAKAGLIGLSNVVAQEGERHNILSNTILPIGATRMLDTTSDRRVTALEEQFFARIDPNRVVPLVVYFASRDCAASHHNVSSGAGRYGRAFMGLTEGWMADPDGPVPSVEDIAEHWSEIASTENFTVPMSSWEEILGICARLGIADGEA